MTHFIGRKRELKTLEQYQKKTSSSLLVIRGRRRIGKSRLASEFASNMNFIKISGLAPTEGSTSQGQRTHFANNLVNLGLSRPGDEDWYNLFLHLAQNLPKGKTVLLLDEISWMASKDDSFLPKLKDVWDDYFSKKSDLILILCGSVSSWIDKNILSSTAFFGRINEVLTLSELSLSESLTLLEKQGFKGSAFEKMMVLSITGGVPWYIEQFMKGNSAEAHISRLCFSADGLFAGEFERIFHDLFDVRAKTYANIVSQLASGAKDYAAVSEMAGYGSSGALSEYLADLEIAGFIKRDQAWDLRSGKLKKIFKYRLSDNYLRYYLKYIQPNLDRIKQGHFKDLSIADLKGFSSVMGLQFENLCLANRDLIFDALNLKRQHIVIDNPYFQKGGKTQKGCQIDYMIQTEFNTLYICEMKFTQNKIGSDVIEEMKAKIKALKKPKHLACLPVLIHFGDVSESVLESDYFYKVMDFGLYLENRSCF